MKKTFYIYQSGTLVRKDDSLALIHKNEDVTYIPVIQTELIICFGDVTLNKRVLGLLNSYDITLVFFNFYGQYIGRFTPKRYIDGKILYDQVHVLGGDRRLPIARIMVETELKNVLALIKYYNKKHSSFQDIIIQIEDTLSKIADAKSVEDLLLLEAKAKKHYYSCFDTIILNKEFIFERRSMHPTHNEVNSMLSYGYALLYSKVLSDLDQSSLMPQLSIIHSLSKSTDALQYDIADMLKPIMIDRLVLRLINKKQMKPEHFDYNGATCYMNKKGIKIFVSEYEKLMTKPVKIGSKYYSYRNLITREVYRLSNYIIGKSKNYTPFVMEW